MERGEGEIVSFDFRGDLTAVQEQAEAHWPPPELPHARTHLMEAEAGEASQLMLTRLFQGATRVG
jgi:hypothetical protein